MAQDDNTRRYSVGEIAKVCGIEVGTLRSWTQRNVILLDEDEDEPAAGPGRPQRLSFGTALQIAITASLVELGVFPARAAEAARAFTEFGETVAVWTGSPDAAAILAAAREPGEGFADGETMLLVGADPAEPAKVVKVNADNPLDAILRRDGATIVLPLDVLARTVRAQLTG